MGKDTNADNDTRTHARTLARARTHTQELRTHHGRHRTLIGHADDLKEELQQVAAARSGRGGREGGSEGSAKDSLSRQNFKTHLVK